MKGIVLRLLGLMIGAVSSFGALDDVDFGIGTNSFSARDPELMLRSPDDRARVGQLVADRRTEERGSRPSLAVTVVRFESKHGDVALQPILGRINGAQIFVSF